MTDWEIVQNWRAAADKKLQIEILADMNVTTKAEICRILFHRGETSSEIVLGYAGRKRRRSSSLYKIWTEADEYMLMQAVQSGDPWEDIAVVMRRSISACKAKAFEIKCREKQKEQEKRGG